MEDWSDEPEYLVAIEDQELRQFALEIHALWKKLCHIVKPEVTFDKKCSLMIVFILDLVNI